MSKKKKTRNKETPASAGLQPAACVKAELSVNVPPKSRWALTLVLLFHVSAVVIPPLNFATRGSGPPQWIYNRLQTYLQFAYLDHGYFFFAPNPGESHLVRYRAEFDDDRAAVEDMFPDRAKQWPRLLYHRHFMLAEHLHASYAVPEPPADLEPAALQQYRAARARYEARWDGFERRLKAKHDADRIEMHRVEHRPPNPLEFLEGKTLVAKELYRDLSEEMPVEEPDNQVQPPRTQQDPLGPAPWRPDLLGPSNGPTRSLDDMESIGPLTNEAGQGP